MARVVGIGGVFVKAKDKAALSRWYEEALGIGGEWGAILYDLPPDPAGRHGYALWSLFKESTDYFDPTTKPFMINFRVDDLDALLKHLQKRGDNVLDRREDGENGKFGYVVDPEGTLLELWEPSPTDPSRA